MHDLLIKNGRIIDPSQNLDEVEDVQIDGKIISDLSKNISADNARNVIDASGCIVTAGLIDLHCHIYHAVNRFGAKPDEAGVNQGVTMVADAGSAGEATLGGITEYIIPSAKTDIFCFLHLSSAGLTLVPELRGFYEINLEAMAEKIATYQSLVKGIKLRLVGELIAAQGIKCIEIAKKIAGEFKLPVMVHLGDTEKLVPPDLTRECLKMMDRGDIVSHIYTGQWGSPLQPDGTIVKEMSEAGTRGVVLDVSPGIFNFSFKVARISLASGIIPTTISTDLTQRSMNERVYGLNIIMSKMMALGLSLNQVIAMTTLNPAKALGMEENSGVLEIGRQADISIFRQLNGKWLLDDVHGDTVELSTLLAPVACVKTGQYLPAKIGEALASVIDRGRA